MDFELPEVIELTPEVIKGLGFSHRALAAQVINPRSGKPIHHVEVAKWYMGTRRPRSWARRAILHLMERLRNGEDVPRRVRRKKTRRTASMAPARIQAILDALGVSQNELAQQTHTNRSSWTRWASGTRRPGPHQEMLLRLLEWHAGLARRPPYPFLDARRKGKA